MIKEELFTKKDILDFLEYLSRSRYEKSYMQESTSMLLNIFKNNMVIREFYDNKKIFKHGENYYEVSVKKVDLHKDLTELQEVFL